MKLVLTDTKSKSWKSFMDALLVVSMAISTLVVVYVALDTLNIIIMTLAVAYILLTIPIHISVLLKEGEQRMANFIERDHDYMIKKFKKMLKKSQQQKTNKKI